MTLLERFLEQDPSLTRKISYEEFQNSMVSFSELDDGIEEAYESYKKVLKEINNK